MADIKTFYLPDLGEGLPDATVVEWHVKEGDTIKLDAPLVSMETAKAVVDVPSPYSGTVKKLHGAVGDIIETGASLADFEIDPNARQRAEAESTGHHHGPKKGVGSQAPDDAHKVIASDDGGEIDSDGVAPAKREDEGTVVGAMISGNAVHTEQVSSAGGVKAVPAVRALAKKMKIDLSRVQPTGAGGVITMQDVKNASANGSAAVGSAPARPAAAQHLAPTLPEPGPAPSRTPVSLAGKAVRTSPPGKEAMGQPEQLKGVRRNMARVMADAQSKVVPTTLNDDADIHAWRAGENVSVRLLRSITTACKAVPALNAWFDGENLTRTLHERVDIGVAVDTVDGLFVPALRNADALDAHGLRTALDQLMRQVRERSIPPSELTGYTISLSNFGVFAGRYATPIVVPPTVAIVAAGKLRYEAVPVIGGIEAHRVIPLSLTFDHRACTGGEAARFLKAMLEDLALAE